MTAPIDWMELETAFESHAPDVHSYLHRTTGAIVTLSVDAAEEERVRLDDDPLYVEVQPVPSREQYRMMERFIETVTQPLLKERLQDSIVGKGAFRRFKDVISRFPDERKRWFAFRDVLLHRHILDWLKASELEVAEMPAWSLELPSTPSETTSTQEGPPALSSAEQQEKHEAEELRAYLLSWARAHGEEYHYLFGPAAFERLASDMAHEFTIFRRRPHE
ncbi:MAG TPA: UPF0158 family protein [Myxococcota bacterium]|jgi:hypothetical protein